MGKACGKHKNGVLGRAGIGLSGPKGKVHIKGKLYKTLVMPGVPQTKEHGLLKLVHPVFKEKTQILPIVSQNRLNQFILQDCGL